MLTYTAIRKCKRGEASAIIQKQALYEQDICHKACITVHTGKLKGFILSNCQNRYAGNPY